MSFVSVTCNTSLQVRTIGVQIGDPHYPCAIGEGTALTRSAWDNGRFLMLRWPWGLTAVREDDLVLTMASALRSARSARARRPACASPHVRGWPQRATGPASSPRRRAGRPVFARAASAVTCARAASCCASRFLPLMQCAGGSGPVSFRCADAGYGLGACLLDRAIGPAERLHHREPAASSIYLASRPRPRPDPGDESP